MTSLAWHAEAKWLVSGSEDGTVKIWDVRFVRTLAFSLLEAYPCTLSEPQLLNATTRTRHLSTISLFTQIKANSSRAIRAVRSRSGISEETAAVTSLFVAPSSLT